MMAGDYLMYFSPRINMYMGYLDRAAWMLFLTV